MPPFPGMGYPLVPGYEAAGEVVEAAASTPGFRPGEHVFVPGASCYRDVARPVRRLGAAAGDAGRRVTRIDAGLGEAGALLALAATARHAIAGPGARLPDLIVGHGVLGRLLARLTVAAGGAAADGLGDRPGPPRRRVGYEVTDAECRPAPRLRVDLRRSGRADLLDDADRPHRARRRDRAGRVLRRRRSPLPFRPPS